MQQAFYRLWHAHPFRETLRSAALGYEIADDDLPPAEGHAWTQLRTAATYLTERAAVVGNRGKARLAAEADRLSVLILEGVSEVPREEPDRGPRRVSWRRRCFAGSAAGDPLAAVADRDETDARRVGRGLPAGPNRPQGIAVIFLPDKEIHTGLGDVGVRDGETAVC